MAGLAENFSVRLTDAGLNMRFEALKGYSIGQVKESAMIIIRTRKYTTMPTVADFIDALHGDCDDLAEIQASFVLQAIGRCGSYSPPTFDDPITADIMLNKINWRDLCASTMKDVNFKLKEFRTLYKAYNKAASGNMINAPDALKKLVNDSTKRIE